MGFPTRPDSVGHRAGNRPKEIVHRGGMGGDCEWLHSASIASTPRGCAATIEALQAYVACARRYVKPVGKIGLASESQFKESRRVAVPPSCCARPTRSRAAPCSTL